MTRGSSGTSSLYNFVRQTLHGDREQSRVADDCLIQTSSRRITLKRGLRESDRSKARTAGRRLKKSVTTVVACSSQCGHDPPPT